MFGELGETLGHLLHDPRLGLEQDPAHPLGATARVELDRLDGEVLQLGESLDAGVSRAHEHEPEILSATQGVLERLGYVEAVEHLVAQRGGIGERLKAGRVLGQTGNGKCARDRAERNDQLVITDLEALTVDPLHAELRTLGLSPSDLADDQIGASQLGAQRHDDMARIERGAGGARKQGRVEHEVSVVDERHVRALRRQQALERTGCIEARKSATRDHHLPCHKDRIGCRP